MREVDPNKTRIARALEAQHRGQRLDELRCRVRTQLAKLAEAMASFPGEVAYVTAPSFGVVGETCRIPVYYRAGGEESLSRMQIGEFSWRGDDRDLSHRGTLELEWLDNVLSYLLEDPEGPPSSPSLPEGVEWTRAADVVVGDQIFGEFLTITVAKVRSRPVPDEYRVRDPQSWANADRVVELLDSDDNGMGLAPTHWVARRRAAKVEVTTC